MSGRKKWLWTALMTGVLAALGGWVYANSQNRGYICPLTGEELPCEKCCPLNQGK
jgi:hypothetical protein